MGINGSPTGSPVLEDVHVPQANVIGRVGKGLSVALATLERTRLGAAPQAVGIAEGASDYANSTRRSASPSAARSTSFQGIQFKLADMESADGGRAGSALQGLRARRPRRPAAWASCSWPSSSPPTPRWR